MAGLLSRVGLEDLANEDTCLRIAGMLIDARRQDQPIFLDHGDVGEELGNVVGTLGGEGRNGHEHLVDDHSQCPYDKSRARFQLGEPRRMEDRGLHRSEAWLCPKLKISSGDRYST